jgi:hypothetical protein
MDCSVRADETYSLTSRAMYGMTVALPSFTCEGSLSRLTLHPGAEALSCHNADYLMCSPL